MITVLGLGAGETWPGEIALTFSPKIASSLTASFKKGIILLAGTNGKTTTSLMITTILRATGDWVVHNATGANLLNGIVSSCIRAADWTGRLEADWGVFEVDENSLPAVLSQCHSGLRAGIHENEDGFRVKPGMRKKLVVVMLNLFRDQLDRYGEVDVIVEKWQEALARLNTGNQGNKPYHLILNADDPGIAWLGAPKKNVTYFGLNDKTKFLKTREHATDSIFCPKCGNRLTYDGVYFSHIGIWKCTKCSLRRPMPDIDTFPSSLPGLYNQYNTLAAVATARSLHIPKNIIQQSLLSFGPAFGRQEEIIINGKTVKLFLSKNPTGFNASLRTVLEMGAKNLLLVLNDRIPDGRDVSWIWDVDFEMIPKDVSIAVSGDRVYDLALRMKYAELETIVEPVLKHALSNTSDQPLYILATYSAMLEVRKIITGRRIL